MKICVYGAASVSIDKIYIETTEELGREMVKRGHSLVFGAGANGLMGAVARGVHECKGEITGIVPNFFNIDGALFENCTEMIKTETMRERKRILEELSDAFIITPGGIGTFDEFFEILTLKQLNRHNKPIIIFNINNYYDSMLSFIDNAISGGFMKDAARGLYHVSNDIEDIFDYLDNYEPVVLNLVETKDIK